MSFKSRLIFLAPIFAAISFAVGNPASVIALRSFDFVLVASLRCFIAATVLVLLGFKDIARVLRVLDQKTFFQIMASAAALAFHFIFWTAGLKYTTFPAAISLVALEPIGVLIAGAIFFSHPPTKRQCVGILIATFGAFIVSFVGGHSSANNLHSFEGDFFVLVSIFFYSIYFTVNRKLKHAPSRLGFTREIKNPDLAFATILFAIAGMISGICFLLFRAQVTNLNFSPNTIFQQFPNIAFIALAIAGIVPTGIGHTLSQISSRRLDPIWVGIISPGETLFSFLLGIFLLRSSPSTVEILGAAIIVLGVTVGVYQRRPPK